MYCQYVVNNNSDKNTLTVKEKNDTFNRKNRNFDTNTVFWQQIYKYYILKRQRNGKDQILTGYVSVALEYPIRKSFIISKGTIYICLVWFNFLKREKMKKYFLIDNIREGINQNTGNNADY